MTDLEITKLCAEAMGWKHLGAVGVEPPKRGEPDPPGLWCLSGGNDWWVDPEGHSVCAPCCGIPDPLHDDAQCFALVKKFRLLVGIGKKFTADAGTTELFWVVEHPEYDEAEDADLNRAICEAVANMQQAK